MTSAPAPGRLERRKARTRAAILAAAGSLFLKRGYEESSIQDIAERADTGVGTVYGYFTSKEQILRAVIEASIAEANQLLQARLDQSMDTTERVVMGLRTMGEYMRENRPLLLAAFAIAARQSATESERDNWLVEAYKRILATGRDRGEVGDLPIDATARTLISVYTLANLGLGIWHGREDDPQTTTDLEDIARRLLRPF